MEIWEREVRHDGLGKFRVVRGRSKYEAEQKAEALEKQWEGMWEKKMIKEKKESHVKSILKLAEEKTESAEQRMEEIRNILEASLDQSNKVDWAVLKDLSEFDEPEPGVEFEYIPKQERKKNVENPTTFCLYIKKKKNESKVKRFNYLVKYVRNFIFIKDDGSSELMRLIKDRKGISNIAYLLQNSNLGILDEVLAIAEDTWDKYNPHSPKAPQKIVAKILNKPDRNSNTYKPHYQLFDLLVKSRKSKINKTYEELYEIDVAEWKRKKAILEKTVEDENIKLENEYNKSIEKFRNEKAVLKSKPEKEHRKWEERKMEFKEHQAIININIDESQNKYSQGDLNHVDIHSKVVMLCSEYPEYFPNEFDLYFNPESGLLLIDRQLPTIDNLPSLKEVRYIKAKGEYKHIHISDSKLKSLYNNIVYQIVLKTINDLFITDEIDAVKSIVFNGWVQSTDKATGKDFTACIVSVQANKQQFLSLDLYKVDPKECFKSLKGIGSPQLHLTIPVAPIIKISKEDKRFTDSYDVLETVDNEQNLAAMDWKDFEHLIRELFEKEFSQSGGEVKVTQASRDGGVDAIAFDPDPIRGGKMVIQAKRYTNLVGVSAVRDLYGTVVNEGATKGILVTTSNYGPDAYGFAKGKPITLLDGGNLLSLLAKHGHKAKIDLLDAKRILSENTKE